MSNRSITVLLAIVLCIVSATTPIRAADSTTREPGVRVITLGTAGGPLPRKDRAQTAELLVVNDALYVIDAGDNVTRRIVQAGYDFRNAGKIFITHDHSDHTLGLATLLVSEWEFQRRDPIDVYGPPGTAAMTAGILPYAKVNSEIRYGEGKTAPMAPIFVGHDSAPGLVYRDANVTVTAAENSHFNFAPGTPGYGKYQSYSYRFDTPRGSVVFTGDTGPSEAVVTLAKDADMLVTEVNSVDDIIARYKADGFWDRKTPAEQAGFIRHLKEEHLEPGEVAKIATRANVKSVVLTHLPPTGDPSDTYVRYADVIRKSYSGRISIAKDLMVFAL